LKLLDILRHQADMPSLPRHRNAAALLKHRVLRCAVKLHANSAASQRCGLIEASDSPTVHTADFKRSTLHGALK
jgi:hypothetical protein